MVGVGMDGEARWRLDLPRELLRGTRRTIEDDRRVDGSADVDVRGEASDGRVLQSVERLREANEPLCFLPQ